MQYEECVKLHAATMTVKPPQPPVPEQTTLQNSYTRADSYERKKREVEPKQ